MTAPTVHSTVIDAMVSIESVHIAGRHRRDLGDLQSLADSIADVGLLNPITMTRDSRLLAGQRRLEACRLLDWAAIPVRFVDTLEDAAKLLRIERDENTCRKDMTASELYAHGKSIEALERPKAKQSQREHGGTAPGRPANTGDLPISSEDREANKTYTKVGEAIGKSGPQWKRLKHIGDRAVDGDQDAAETLQRIDAGQESIAGAYESLRERDRERESAEVDEPAPAFAAAPVDSEPDEDWIPAGTDRSRKAVERRRELIREMAPRGYTSGQMAELLGIKRRGLKEIAKENEIPIVADQVIGRSRHRIDSNRIIREIVQDLENTEMSLGLVDFSELDTSLIENWTISLSKSIRMLSRLNKQLKEMVQ